MFGAMSDRALCQRSLGININLEWGMVLLVFGVGMGARGFRGMKSDRRRGDKELSGRRVSTDDN